MNVIAGMNADALGLVCWLVAIVVGTLSILVQKRLFRTNMVAVAVGAITGTLTYLVSTIMVTVYILTRPTDERWTSGGHFTIGLPALPDPSGIPFAGSFLAELIANIQQWFASVAGIVGDTQTVIDAGTLAAHFAGRSFLAAAVLPLFLTVWVVAKWRETIKARASLVNQQKQLVSLRVEVEQLKNKLAD